MEEIWKPVAGYTYYEVSNLGKVRSLDRRIHIVVKGTPCSYVKEGRILTPNLINKYYSVYLTSDNGTKKYVRIHRLVASAFIPNLNNLPCINHKDENKLNNNVDNLEWCTFKYNSNYNNLGQRISSILRNNEKQSKPVQQYDLSGNLIKEYPSIIEAERETGISNVSISKCCRGFYVDKGKRVNIYKAGGYKWKYKKN